MFQNLSRLHQKGFDILYRICLDQDGPNKRNLGLQINWESINFVHCNPSLYQSFFIQLAFMTNIDLLILSGLLSQINLKIFLKFSQVGMGGLNFGRINVLKTLILPNGVRSLFFHFSGNSLILIVIGSKFNSLILSNETENCIPSK